MSITHSGNVTLTSATVRDGCTDETNNRVCLVESSSNTFRQYDLSSPFNQFGSNLTVLSTPAAVCLINASSAVIASSAVSTVDFVELASNTRTNVSGGATVGISTAKGQLGAGDTSNGIAFFCNSNSRKLTKIVASTYAITQPDVAFTANSTATAIIFKGSGRFLVGTSNGHIYEIDTTPVIKDAFVFGLDPNVITGTQSFTSTSIRYLSYDNNILTFSTVDGTLVIMDWSTKTVLHKSQPGKDNGISLCQAASGIALASRNWTTGANNLIYELDFTIEAPRCDTNGGIYFTDSTGAIPAMGVNTSNATGWALQSTTNKIRIFSVAPRASTTTTFTVQYPSGTNVKARILCLDDTSGVGTVKRTLDTYMQSPGTYRVPTGKSIVWFPIFGDGTNARSQIKRIST